MVCGPSPHLLFESFTELNYFDKRQRGLSVDCTTAFYSDNKIIDTADTSHWVFFGQTTKLQCGKEEMYHGSNFLESLQLLNYTEATERCLTE